MFDRVTLHAGDVEASRRFYEIVLTTLGLIRTDAGRDRPVWQEFGLQPGEDKVTRRLHIGFAAPSREHVERFWQEGVHAGYASDGEPGPRSQYRDDYYGAFLLDPDGNSAEAVHHGAVRTDGAIDHLWIRVSDLAASRAFYAELAQDAEMRIGTDLAERVSFVAPAGGSFSLVPGEPTEALAMGIPAVRGAATIDPDGNSVALVNR
jgi:catechol 2,3-dioxygenase-like lactoylglutathione lyase family enzyme